MNTTTHSPWSRVMTVTNETQNMAMSYTQFLSVSELADRLTEAMLERPDAGVRDWLEYALSGDEIT